MRPWARDKKCPEGLFFIIWSRICLSRIIKYPELEVTHQDQVQLPNLQKATPKIPSCAWDHCPNSSWTLISLMPRSCPWGACSSSQEAVHDNQHEAYVQQLPSLSHSLGWKFGPFSTLTTERSSVLQAQKKNMPCLLYFSCFRRKTVLKLNNLYWNRRN